MRLQPEGNVTVGVVSEPAALLLGKNKVAKQDNRRKAANTLFLNITPL
jgi:hypothetical protein